MGPERSRGDSNPYLWGQEFCGITHWSGKSSHHIGMLSRDRNNHQDQDERRKVTCFPFGQTRMGWVWWRGSLTFFNHLILWLKLKQKKNIVLRLEGLSRSLRRFLGKQFLLILLYLIMKNNTIESFKDLHHPCMCLPDVGSVHGSVQREEQWPAS